MRTLTISLAALIALSGSAVAQTDKGLCDQEKGYIEVYKQFVIGWSDAVNAGTLVDPKKTDIAVWVSQWENRMLQGVPVPDLCREMIDKRAEEAF